MYNQLSWNITLETVMRKFAKRSKSNIVDRSMTVMDQVNKSGGNTEDIMDALATNIEQIRDSQEEKSVLLRQQVVMIYAIFFIFLGISLALLKFLAPLAKMGVGQPTIAGMETLQFSGNPCQPCVNDNSDPACASCDFFKSVSLGMGFVDQKAIDAKDQAANADAYYRSLFFIMITVQAFCSGLVCGQIGDDSISAGVKHSLIMLIFGVSTFLITLKVGII
jgi:flagellar protein FlaJ